ncbi:hypothetical protein L249_5758 [Ophiocordyceps polyrhachis-furcata BCC 54312]|uniref:Uncharacterized protein n=1 Tax=Ophiocordyceps polyrhachis-furcata BCC 54312 TaxID=1330021 RepID=A0A367KZT7_9HYPO|nr:hypothetical protein L249_5758 [Ophiocordyceps polyrhachis-furcata BCC 54312]
MSSVNEIAFGTSLAAVSKGSSIRVYALDVNGGIREIKYEGKWSGGTSSNVLAKGRIGSPLAAASLGLDHIRIYYLDADCNIQEKCWDGKGWYDGSLGDAGFKVAPYSGGLSVIYLDGKSDVIRVYGQVEDEKIQEFKCNVTVPASRDLVTSLDDGGKGWQKGHTFDKALPGSSIAATTWSSTLTHIRPFMALELVPLFHCANNSSIAVYAEANFQLSVYYQTENLNITEVAWDGFSWNNSGFSIPDQPPRSAVAVTSWYKEYSVNIRLFYAAAACMFKEKEFSGGWFDGGFGEESVAGSCVAVIVADTLRTYVQVGNLTSGITEFAWSDGWVTSKDVLPPA